MKQIHCDLCSKIIDINKDRASRYVLESYADRTVVKKRLLRKPQVDQEGGWYGGRYLDAHLACIKKIFAEEEES